MNQRLLTIGLVVLMTTIAAFPMTGVSQTNDSLTNATQPVDEGAVVEQTEGNDSGSSGRSEGTLGSQVSPEKPADPKISSGLSERLGGDSSLQTDTGGGVDRVTVRVNAISRDGEAAAFHARGLGDVAHHHGDAFLVTLPRSAVPTLASHDDVGFVSEPVEQTQTIVSEGVDTMNATAAQARGFSGRDAEVAVIDSGFDLSDPEIAGNVNDTRNFTIDPFQSDVQHGTASAQLVNDTAPSVTLNLYKSSNTLQFLSAIDHIEDNTSTDVVTYSAGYPGFLRNDGESGIDRRVDRAVENDSFTFFTSSGNYANGAHWNGTWQDGDGNGVLNFSASQNVNLVKSTGSTVDIRLHWDEWPASSNDYDLYLRNASTGTVVASSTTSQTGTQEPRERVTHTPSGSYLYAIQVQNFSADLTADFDLWALGGAEGNLQYFTDSRSVTSPGTARNATAIGAAYWDTQALEPFSSRGPTLDGRSKPDLTAPDGVSTSIYGTSPPTSAYFGTSAASPHAAGAAALMYGQRPAITPEVVEGDLAGNATSITGTEPDNQAGAGLIDVNDSMPEKGWGSDRNATSWPIDSTGDVGPDASVFQGEEDISFARGVDAPLTGIPGMGAGGESLSTPPIPETQVTGVYGDGDGENLTVRQPRIQSFELVNEAGAELGGAAQVGEQEDLLVVTDYNFRRAEDVELVINDSGGVGVQNVAVEDTGLTAAQQSYLTSNGGSTGDLATLQQGLGNTDLSPGEIAAWTVNLSAVPTGTYTFETRGIRDLDFGQAVETASIQIQASTSVSGCRDIDAPGSYQLTADITNPGVASCINITSGDVTFDGQGHTIAGTASELFAVRATNFSGPIANVTVRNVTATGWGGAGVAYINVTDGRIQNVNASGNDGFGVHLFSGSHRTNVTSSIATGNVPAGVRVANSRNVNVTGVNASINGNGTVGDGVSYGGVADDGFLENVTALANTEAGIELNATARVVNSTATNNTWDLASNGATDASAENLDVGRSTAANTTIDVDLKNGRLRRTTAPPADDAGLQNVSRYVTADNDTADAYLNLTIRYDDSDVTSVGATESALAIYGHDGANWVSVPGSSVDTAANAVHANVTPVAPSPPRPFGALASTGTPELDDISSCRTIDASNAPTDGLVNLTADITNSGASSCINVTVSDVTLRGGNHTVDGTDAAGSVGINVTNASIASPISNVTVSNVTMTDWGTGVQFLDVDDGRLDASTLVSNGGIGGVWVRGIGVGTTVTGNDLTSNSRGIDVNANQNTVVDNTVSGSSADAVQVSGTGNAIRGNVLVGNLDGVQVAGSDTVVEDNNVSLASQDGIRISGGASNVTLRNNTALDATRWAIATAGVPTNNSATNLTIGPTDSESYSIDVTGRDMQVVENTSPPSDPSGVENLSRFVKLNASSSDAWAFLNVSYDPAEVSGSESDLEVWKWNGTTGWVNAADVPGVDGVNTAEDYVYTNTSQFSVVAPMEPTAGPGGGLNDIGSCRTINASNAPSDGLVNLTGDITNAAVDPCINVTVGGLTFDGQDQLVDGTGATGPTGISVFNASGTISDVTVRNVNTSDWGTSVSYSDVDGGLVTDVNATPISSPSTAISIGGASIGVHIRDNLIREGVQGISPVDDSVVANNTLTSGVSNGIVAGATTTNLTVRDNDLNGVSIDGIVFNNNGGDTVIASNDISSPGRTGISVDGGHDGTVIRDNTITDAGANGTVVQGSANDTTLMDNRIETTGDSGVFVYDASNVTIENATVENTTGEGIRAYGGAISDLVINESSVNGTTGSAIAGITINAGTGVRVTNNTVANTSLGAGVVVTVAGVDVVDNVIRDTGNDGIRTGISADDTRIIGNRIANVGNEGMELSSFAATSTPHVVRDNVITSPALDGIRTDNNVSEHVFVNNTVTGVTGDDHAFVTELGVGAGGPTVVDLNIGASTAPDTSLTFNRSRNVTIRANASPPSDPTGQQNIGRYVDVNGTTPSSYIALNVSYDAGDVSGAEGDLAMWKYNASGWVNMTTVPGADGVDTAADYVYTNTSEFSVVAPMEPTAAPTTGLNNINSCRTINASNRPSDGLVNLTASLSNRPYSSCINVTVSDITFDGGDHTVDGDSSGGSGVLVQNASRRLANVTIRNVDVTDWGDGIDVVNTGGGLIRDVEATSNDDGVYLVGANTTNVTASNLSANTNRGAYIDGSDTNNVTQNTITANDFGLIVQFGADNRVIDNTFNESLTIGARDEGTRSVYRSNLFDGSSDTLYIQTGDNTSVLDNTFQGEGISSQFADDVVVRNNTIDSSADNGIDLGADNAGWVVENNTVRDTAFHGITVNSGASDSVFRNNTANASGVWDYIIQDDSTNVTVEGLDVGPSTVDNTEIDVRARNVTLRSEPAPPSDPAQTQSIGRFVEADNVSSTTYLNITFHYNDSDVASVDESRLAVWKHNGSWTELGSGPATDAAANEIQYNVTEVGSVFAPLANTTAVSGGLNDINSCRTINASNRPSDGLVNLTSDITNSPLPSCINVTVGNVTFDGQGHVVDSDGTGGIGVNVTNTSTRIANVTVRDVNVTDWGTYGIDATDVDDVTVNRSTAIGNQNGINTYRTGATVVAHNRIEDAGVTAIGVSGVGAPGGQNLVYNNTVNATSGAGSAVVAAQDDTSIVGNTVNDTTGGNRAIRVYSGSDLVVRDNVVGSSGDTGSTVTGILASSDGARIVNNTVVDNVGTGIQVDLFGAPIQNVTVARNDVRNTTGAGIVQAGSDGDDDIAILNNDVNGSTDDGIRVNDTTNLNVTRNDASFNGRKGIEVRYADGARVHDNRVVSNNQNAGGEGVLLERLANATVTDNNVSDNLRVGVSLNDTEGSVVRDNVIRSNTGGFGGINLLSTNDTRTVGNNVSENTGPGVNVGKLVSQDDTRNVTVRDSIIGRNGQAGVELSSGLVGADLVNLTVRDNADGGVEIFSSATQVTIERSTIVRNDPDGVSFGGPTDSVVRNSTVRDNAAFDVDLSAGTNISAENVSVGASTAADTRFSASGHSFGVTANASPPTDPAGYGSIGRYLNVTATTPPATAFVNVSYDAGDVSGAEGDLAMWKYNASGWVNMTNVPGVDGVDTADDYVYTNTGEFSVVAPMEPTAAPGGGLNDINSCRTINASNAPSDGLVNLTQDINDATPSSCINITVSQITLDGQGHLVDGDGDDGVGVNVTNATTAIDNVTVRDMTATDWGVSGGGDAIRFSADDGLVTNVNASNNFRGMILLSGADRTNVTDSIFNDNAAGVDVDASDVLLRNVTASNNNFGIQGSSTITTPGFVIRNSTAENNNVDGLGIAGTAAIFDTTARGNDPDLDVSDRVVTAENLDIGTSTAANTELGLSLKNVALVANTSPPADPSDERNISRFVEATNSSASHFLNVTFQYTNADVASVDESRLDVWMHNGSWTELGTGPATDAAANEIQYNVTSVGSVFAPLANTSTAGGADFAVDVPATNSPVVEGEALNVTANVTNVGSAGGTQTVNLSVGGAERDVRSVTLASGASQEFDLSWSTGSGDAGSYTATVASENDTASTGATVLAPANLSVRIDGTNSPVTEGDTLDVTANVSNVGGSSATQTITLTANGSVQDTQSVTLASGASQTITLSWPTSVGENGSYTATVDSANDSDSTPVSVQAASGGPPVLGGSPNDDPYASFDIEPRPPETGGTATFDADPSSDPDGHIVTYRWSIDGSQYYGEEVDVTFGDARANHVVELTVIDDGGASDTAQTQFVVTEPAPSPDNASQNQTRPQQPRQTQQPEDGEDEGGQQDEESSETDAGADDEDSTGVEEPADDEDETDDVGESPADEGGLPWIPVLVVLLLVAAAAGYWYVEQQ